MLLDHSLKGRVKNRADSFPKPWERCRVEMTFHLVVEIVAVLVAVVLFVSWLYAVWWPAEQELNLLQAFASEAFEVLEEQASGRHLVSG